ncbi:hypothetical protein CANINC_000575 [Pichia inconspicua]|uniref:Major facilitator superfamily (MFS) profile domain-containing protein n=1 Tax=Pichia inconspicua TaxID=52247 RepID=A0A4T0X5W0_9ASCO|nr:hypothetical protein CANINC_000575 [[Candida] inconspicua]
MDDSLSEISNPSTGSIEVNYLNDNGYDSTENQQQSQRRMSNILTRTSTVISQLKEDNKFAKTQVSNELPYDPMISNNDNDNCDDDLEGFPDSSQNTQQVKDTGEYNIYDIENKPPDGGVWAWIATGCVLCINTFSWGLNACFGVFLNYYTTTNFFPGARMEQYVMIGGMGLGLSFMTCVITNGLCRKYNFKLIMYIGTALTFLSYWLASIAKTVVQLIMFQGFMMGIGWGLVAGATFMILPTWFLKKRSVAQGIATAGGGLGGIIFSRPTDEIIKKYMNDPKYANDPHEGLRKGISWALRMQALVCGAILLVSVFLIRTYRPLKNDVKKPILKEMFGFLKRWDLIKQVPIMCLIIWNMVYGLAYTILLFSLSSYATSIGLSYLQGSNVTTVQSVAQTIGRPMLGFISDKIGRVNTTCLCTFIIAIFTFCFWIFTTTYSELLGFAFVIGLFLGVNWVNFGPMTADVVGGGPELNHTISLLMFSGGFPLLIAELAGLKLRRPQLSNPFLYCQILVGVASIISVACLLPLREWKVSRILNARLKLLQEEKELDEEKHTSSNHPEIERLEYMLQSDIYHYLIRMFYPIAV